MKGQLGIFFVDHHIGLFAGIGRPHFDGNLNINPAQWIVEVGGKLVNGKLADNLFGLGQSFLAGDSTLDIDFTVIFGKLELSKFGGFKNL
ncbi:MAG: hypothetical protein NUV70_08670 [Caldiserica bacterium]|nr:hypothetical protein [Caldisericota bacterium]